MLLNLLKALKVKALRVIISSVELPSYAILLPRYRQCETLSRVWWLSLNSVFLSVKSMSVFVFVFLV